MACLDENEVVALATGTLAGDALTNAQSHLDSCVDCLDLLSMFQQSAVEDGDTLAGEGTASLAENQPIPLSESEEINLVAQEGTTIGRYKIIRSIGRGGMGVVYLARDPNLDRLVAIKLVKPSLQGDERAEHFERRLMREARAMAKLNHRNVLTIYDVGKHEGQVFLASEWIDGGTLEDWISGSTHRWQSVLSPFIDAARGLEAAHAAGLVHRDFKPSNVMVGKDDRVLVFDFGLVKSTTVRLDDITTQLSGNFIVGTPAYMAPEQMIGDPADARSDQFSFCASLYESIGGKRPFAGRSLMELLANIKAGKIEEPKNIPVWLWDMLKRGLRRKPEERFESMSEVLEILEAGLAERRRRTLVVSVSVLMGAAAIAAGFLLWGGSVNEDEICGETQTDIAGVWDSQLRRQVRDGMMSSELSYAEDSWNYVSSSFDEYAIAWHEGSRTSCLDTSVRNLQNKEIYTRRKTCYERLAVEFNAVTTRLQVGDQDSVYHAVAIAQKLKPISQCNRTKVILNYAEPLSRKEGWNELKVLDNLITMKKYREAQVRAQAMLEKGVDHRPTEAWLSTVLGVSLNKQHKYREAIPALEQAFYAGVAGKNDEIAAIATCEIFQLYSQEIPDEKSARRWHQLAKAAVERDGSPVVQARWLYALAAAAIGRNEMETAREYYRGALDQLEDDSTAQMSIRTKGMQSLGMLLLRMGQGSEAEEVFREILALRLRSMGQKHPQVAVTRANIARALHAQGRVDLATKMGQAALDSLVEAVGEDDAMVGITLNLLAEFSVSDGDAELANRQLLRALEIKKKIHGPGSKQLMSTLINLMEVDRMRGNFADVIRHGEAAFEIGIATGQSEVGTRMYNLRLSVAEARLETGDVSVALEFCQALHSSNQEMTTEIRGRVLSCIGRARLAMKGAGKSKRADSGSEARPQ